MINANTVRTINETKTYNDSHRNVKPKSFWKHADYLADIEGKLYKRAYNTHVNTRTDFIYYDFCSNNNLCTKWLVVNKLRENGYKIRMTDDYNGIYIQW